MKQTDNMNPNHEVLCEEVDQVTANRLFSSVSWYNRSALEISVLVQH